MNPGSRARRGPGLGVAHFLDALIQLTRRGNTKRLRKAFGNRTQSRPRMLIFPPATRPSARSTSSPVTPTGEETCRSRRKAQQAQGAAGARRSRRKRRFSSRPGFTRGKSTNRTRDDGGKRGRHSSCASATSVVRPPPSLSLSRSHRPLRAIAVPAGSHLVAATEPVVTRASPSPSSGPVSPLPTLSQCAPLSLPARPHRPYRAPTRGCKGSQIFPCTFP